MEHIPFIKEEMYKEKLWSSLDVDDIRELFSTDTDSDDLT